MWEIFKLNRTFGAKRSPLWKKVRAEHLTKEPKCRVCEGIKDLTVHHVMPFHLYPQYELDHGNLITLCETKKNGINCHLAIGHLGNFSSFNVNVNIDAESWQKKIRFRP